MPLKKQERKEAYIKVINAMGRREHKEAWELMISLTADDTGLFIFTSYEDVVKSNAKSSEEYF